MQEICFVRFGEIPENERSGIYDGDNGRVGEELGVSVYEAVCRGSEYRILLPAMKISTCYVLSGFSDDYACANSKFRRAIYLVTGNVAGIGSDGEPLLRNVQIVRKLKITDVKGMPQITEPWVN